MKTDPTLMSGAFSEMMKKLVCCTLNLNRSLVIAMAFVFSSSLLIAQTETNGYEATIIVKQQDYPGDGMMPQEVQAMVSEYNSSLTNGPLGDTEPTGTPPTIENCPDDQTVECFGNVGHTASELEYTINCGANGIIIIYEPPGILETGSCPGTEYVVTYDVWDQCGNNVTCEQIFTIDNPGPEITFCPEGGIIESADEAVSNEDALEFTFSCPEDPLCSDISVSVEYSEMNEPCVGDMFIYTYTVTDACGRSDVCEQIYTIPPADLEIECADSEVVECLSDINPSEDDVELIGLIEGVEFDVMVGIPMLISGDAGCSGAVYEVSYMVSDDCDRQASCTRTYTLENDGPTITAPADVIIECTADAVSDVDGASFTTSCGLGADVTAEGPILVEGDGICVGSIWKYTYTVTDECGRTASADQMVTISNDGPSIEVPENVSIDCGDSTEPSETGSASASDPCEGDLDVFFEDEVISEACPQVIERTWSAMNGCEVMVSGVQTITIVDEEAPVFDLLCQIDFQFTTSEGFDCPSDAAFSFEVGDEFSVSEGYTIAGFDAPSLSGCVVDNCTADEDLIIRVAAITEEGDGCNKVFTVDFEAIDECENVGGGFSCTYTIIDDEAPVLNMPEVTEGETSCTEVSLEDAEAYVNGELTEEEAEEFINGVRAIFIEQGLFPEGATDDCGDASFDEIDIAVSLGECPSLVTFECIFVAVDECENTSEPISTFLTLVDDTPPVITCPADAEVSCEDGDSPDVTGMATATDDCSDATVSYDDVVVSEGCPTVIERTFTATDACGLTSSCTQTITITYDDPTITAPEAVVIECATDAVADIDGVEFTTACDLEGEVTADGPNLLEGDGLCDGSLWEFVYTVTDDCGRTASASQLVTIENDGPSITAPDAVIIECAADAEADIEGVSFETSCAFGGVVTAEGPNLVEGDGFCSGSVWEFVYTVTDDCDRTASATQMVTIENDGASLEVPDAITISCEESTLPEMTGMAMASEACVGDLEVSYDDEILEEACPLVIQRTWSVETECDGTLTGIQIITVVDDEAPVLNMPDVTEVDVTCSDLSLEDALAYAQGELDEDEAAEFLASAAALFVEFGLIPEGATDNCGEADFIEIGIEVEVPEVTCPTLVELTCIFVAIDECENTSEPASTTISIVDNTPPVITCPADAEVSCEDGDSPDVTGMATATDDCSDATVSYDDVVISEGCPTVIERTFTATDACGLTSSCTQTITITYDNPTITAPEAVVIECATDAIADVDGVEFTTACDLEGEVTADGPILLEGDGLCDGSLWEFVYTVTDACGRTASASQMVTIENDGPSIEAPEDIELICIDDFEGDANDASAEASCDFGLELSISEPVLIQGQGSCNLTQYEVTYTATDDCGRSASDVQIVTCINDGLDIIETPENLIVECYDDIVPDPWALEYFSPCSSDVFIQVTPPTQLCCTEDCPGAQYSVIYTITNDCGDEQIVEQIFTIDNDGPTIITCGEDEEVESVEDIVVSIDDVEYETACGTECEVTVVSEPEIVDNGCDGTDYIYTYSIIDDCGRTATCERTFTILSDDPACLLDDDCDSFTTFYADINGNQTTLYSVVFTPSEALLTYETEVDFSAHIAFDAVNSVVYLVNDNGSSLLAYDPSTDTELFDLTIGGNINQLFAVVYNPADELIYVGDANDDEIYTLDPTGSGDIDFFANAPVEGGDLAIQDGILYLVNRGNTNLYTVVADADGISDGTSEATLVGPTNSSNISGMAQANNATSLILSNGTTTNFTKVNATDASTENVYMAMLDGEIFELASGGDMAAGCANNFGIPPCSYRLYYTHNPSGTSDYSLLEVELDPLGVATYTVLAEGLPSSHIGLSPDGSIIYTVGGSNVGSYDVESGTTTNVAIFDGSNNAGLSSFPACVVGGPDDKLYIAGAGNNVWECNPLTGEATNIASNINVNGGDLIWAPTGENEEEELWIITRNDATFRRVLDPNNGAFSVDVSEINGAAVLENGNVLLADGDGNSLFKEVDLSTQEVVRTYDIDLPLNNGDLAGGCTEVEEVVVAIAAGSVSFPSEVYPNPANDNAMITFVHVESVRTQVDLFDMSGRPVQSLFNATVKSDLEYRVNVNTSAFENGIYLYRITNGSHQVTKKLMIVD
ncbi:MAG TPA: T9SS type A sorting domain-containing protein [Cryomorphaceae bacterium]|nr:T9SS type A sorting domain-containing protein [Cryomorphaceae bacterium]